MANFLFLQISQHTNKQEEPEKQISQALPVAERCCILIKNIITYLQLFQVLSEQFSTFVPNT